MKNKTLMSGVALFILIGLSFLMLKPMIFASSLSEERCNSLQDTQADSCWHAFAHQTLNKEFCNNIIDNETREHCFEHIPKTNP